MLKFSRLHSDSFLVYDDKDNHIGEVFRSEVDDYNVWRVFIENEDSGIKFINLQDAKQAAENIFLSRFDAYSFDVGC